MVKPGESKGIQESFGNFNFQVQADGADASDSTEKVKRVACRQKRITVV